MKLLIAPHNDDEVLWASFTIMRERPVVLVVFDSHVQESRGFKECDAVTRRQETLDAIDILTASVPNTSVPVRFTGLNDRGNYTPDQVAGAIKRCVSIEAFDEIFAPAHEDGGHEQHNLVATAVLTAANPGQPITSYTTYVRGVGKTRSEHPVPIESGEWIRRKLRALACYKTQIDIEELGCRPWFVNEDLREYYL